MKIGPKNTMLEPFDHGKVNTETRYQNGSSFLYLSTAPNGFWNFGTFWNFQIQSQVKLAFTWLKSGKSFESGKASGSQVKPMGVR